MSIRSLLSSASSITLVSRLALGGAVAVSAMIGCSAAGDGQHGVGETSSAITGAHAGPGTGCDAPNLTPDQIDVCLQAIATAAPQQAYCDGNDGGSVYMCGDFSNSLCDQARANDIACAPIGINCTATDGGSDGHSVSVVYIGGECFFVDGQRPNAPVVAGPWLAENGSCNTYTPNDADEVCNTIDAGPAKCAWIYQDGGGEVNNTTDGCKPILRDAGVAQAASSLQ